MKVNRQFSKLSLGELLHLIEHHRRYTDFNTLGLFRSILENTRLSAEQAVTARDAAVVAFRKPFEFLQLKDPVTYFELIILGQKLTKADEEQIWSDIRSNQQRILADKKLRHRNFGTYSKHLCSHDSCHLNGVMVRQGSILVYGGLQFCSDRNRYAAQAKAEARKQDQNRRRAFISRQLEEE